MKTIIATLFIYLSITNADQQRDWYKAQMDTHVLPPYSEAFRILQARVLHELIAVNPVLLDDVSVTQLANRLLCAARDAHSSLDKSVVASAQLLNQLNDNVTSSLVQISAYQKSIADIELEIVQTDQSLHGVQAALVLTEQAVHVSEGSVQVAEQKLRQAEHDVEQAKKCHGLLRKRSHNDIPITTRKKFGSIFRPIIKPIENAIKDVIIKPVCSVINMNAVHSAKNERDYAYAGLEGHRQQAAHYRQLLSDYQQQKLNLDAQLIRMQSNLMQTKTVLNILQDELLVTIDINTQLKNVGLRLSSIHVGSTALQAAVTNMIDFDHLLIPLNAIYAAMSKFTTIDTVGHVPLDLIEQAKVHLTQIALLIPEIPFNTNTDLTCG